MLSFNLKRTKESVISRADRAREARQWEVAAQLYRAALDRNPRNPPIWVQYGHALKEAGRIAEGEAAYRQAIAEDPQSADPHLQLGHVLKLQGRSEDAQSAYVRALTLDPSLNDAGRELAALGWSQGQLSQLREATGRSAMTDSNGVRRSRRRASVITLADRAGAAGQWEQAARLYRKALDRNPKNPPIWVQYGHAMKAAGRLSEAEAAYRQALSYDPDAADPYLQLGHALKLQGKTQQAQAAYLRAFILSPTRDLPELREMGWTEERLTELNRLLQAEPHAAPPLSQEKTSPDPEGIDETAGADKITEIKASDLYHLSTLKPRGPIAVVLHLFYPELWTEIKQSIENISYPFDLFVSLVQGHSDSMRDAVIEAFPHAWILDFENRGRDIGPFMAFVRSGVLFKYDLVCKLHTKRSPHTDDGDTWRQTLINGVLGSSELVNQIVAQYRADPDLGMVVAEGNIYGGPESWAGTERQLGKLLPRLGISPEVQDRSFPGGSIFWIRPFLLRTLCALGLTLEDFDPEPTPIDGALCHAVERIFGLICENAGMKVMAASFSTPQDLPSPVQNADVKIIANYLPQFHPIPENDAWWGRGFTEWTNVTRARPLFENHRQPRLPSDLGFYDLRVPEVREAQAALARQYGVTAFCYYYYWFNGRRILNRPLDEILGSGTPDFPFLICWANEPWTRNWDGLDQDVLLPQAYEPGWPARLARDLAPLLRDRRYVRFDGKPMVLIYRVGHLPNCREAVAELRDALALEGLDSVHLVANAVNFPGDVALPEDPSDLGLDAYSEFPPHRTAYRSPEPLPSALPGKLGGIYDYDHVVSASLANLSDKARGTYHRGVMTSWDNTPRRGEQAYLFYGATPANFRRWLRGVIVNEARQGGERAVFVNAWNEWGEGAYLEPDRDFGHGWLEAVASSLGRRVRGRRRVQVHRSRALGDVILITPVLRALRKTFPDDEITVSTDYPEILLGNPNLDTVLKSPTPLPGFDETLVLEYELEPDRHIVDAYAQIAQVSVSDRTPEIYLREEERIAAYELLRNAGIDLSGHFCVMQITSGWRVRDWPVDRFKQVAAAIEEAGGQVVILGQNADPPIDFGIDLRGQTTVRSAAAIIEKCLFAVTIDSSLMHMAYAFRRPVISLFGCTDPTKRVPDWALASTLYGAVECRGCHHRQRPVPAIAEPTCLWQTVRCMESISADAVIAEAIKQIERVNRPVVSIVIPHYTDYSLIDFCLSSIFRCAARVAFEVIVVLDASPDDSRQRLQAWQPRTRVVDLRENRGFSGACNAGAEIASGKYLLFLNNDTEATPGWLDELVGFIEADPRVGIAGPKLLYPNSAGIQHCGTVFNERGLGEHIYRLMPEDFAVADRPRYYRAVTGACLLIERTLFQAIGGFDTTFHGSGGCEDTDLCFRVLESGKVAGYCPTSVVYHYEGVTRGLRNPDHPEDSYNRSILQKRWEKYLFADISDYDLLAEIESKEGTTWRWLRDVPPETVARYAFSGRDGTPS